MKFLALLVLFSLLGMITPAPRASLSPKVVFRMEGDESGESDETDLAEDDEPLGDSSEEVPQWSFREVNPSEWQHQENQYQPEGAFRRPQNQLQTQHGPNTPPPIRRFRDDDSDEEEDDEDEDDEDFNDDVVHSDIQYGDGQTSSVSREGGFRSAISGETVRAQVVRRPMGSFTVVRYPVSSNNRMQMPVSNRIHVMSNPRPSSYGNNRRVMAVQMSQYPQRATTYPMRRVTPMMMNNQYRQKPYTMMTRPMMYNRYQTPIRQPSITYVPNNYMRTRRPVMATKPLQYYYTERGVNRRNRNGQFW